MDLRVIQFCLVAMLLNAISVYSGQFQPWSEKVFQFTEREYGKMAAKRLRYLHDLAENNQGLSVIKKLKLVNKTMNHLPWIADEKHWKNADYWATPLETISTFGGDCEDIAIAKWVMLRLFGIPGKHLRLAGTKIKQTGERHMVLLYIENPDDPPDQMRVLVLDNYVSDILRGPQRTDLLGMYLFNASGDIMLLSDTGKNRSIKGVYTKRKIKKLEDLKEKIIETRSKYQKLNNGRPFLPSDS